MRELAIIGFVFILTYSTYHKWRPNIFIGDDLSLWFLYKNNLFATGFSNVISGVEHAYDKYRPLFVLLLSLEFDEFGKSLYKYFVFNTFVVSVNSWIISKLIRNIIPNLPGNILILILVVVSTSRFLTYQVTQVWGTLEHTSSLFILLSIYITNVRTSNTLRIITVRRALASIVLCFCGVFIHERYLVVFIYLGIIFWRRAGHLSKHKVILSTSSILSFCLALFGRSWISNIPILVGTGGEKIAVNIPNIASNVAQAILSILGLNWGPEHLIGAKFTEIGTYSAIHMAIIILIIITISYHRRELVKQKLTQDFGELILLGAVLLVPPAATFRMEQRWEYFPFVTFIVAISIVTHQKCLHNFFSEIKDNC